MASRKHIPGTQTLMAFEAAARHGSFARAADELALTEGAISRQIAKLEAQLDIRLFLRTGNRVTLSEAGVHYADQVRDILARLERESRRVSAQPVDGGVLDIAVIPTFATRWLIPRLGDFARQHPELIVNLAERADPFLINGSGFDLAIHFDHPAWTGTAKVPLFSEALVPVCSPSLLKGPTKGSKRKGVPPLAGLPLLHKRSTPDAWQQFDAETGLLAGNSAAGSHFDLYSMIIAAATAGLGVGLVPACYVAQELARGDLVAPWPADSQLAKTYAVLVPDERRDTARVTCFVDWLAEQARQHREAVTAAD